MTVNAFFAGNIDPLAETHQLAVESLEHIDLLELGHEGFTTRSSVEKLCAVIRKTRFIVISHDFTIESRRARVRTFRQNKKLIDIVTRFRQEFMPGTDHKESTVRIYKMLRALARGKRAPDARKCITLLRDMLGECLNVPRLA